MEKALDILVLNPPTREGKGFIREGRCNQESGVWTTLWPPISLATLAAVLERDGHRVRGLDAGATGFSRQRLLQDVAHRPPEAVIWSTGTPSIADDLALADELKSVAPRTRTAVLGTHVTALDRRCLEQTRGLDAIFRNEPEATAGEWAQRIASGQSLDGLLGLSFRSGSDIVRNPDRPFLDDLDSLPDPAWHLFDLDAYRLPLKGDRFLMVTPHRGCPYPCSFCTAQTYYGSRLRKRSTARVVSEIERNLARYGVKEYFFWSDTFTLHKGYVLELCQALEPLGISWASNSRVDSLDRELAEAMRRAGCWMVSFGIETGDQTVLETMGKGASVHQAETAVASAKAAGLKVAGHFVLGLPGETRESLERTIDFAGRLPLDFVQYYCAVPLPGSRLYETAREKGWLVSEDFSRFRQDDAVLNLPGLTPEEVLRYRQLAYRQFYLKPQVLLGAFSLLSPRNLAGVGRGLQRFLRWAGKAPATTKP